MRVIVHHDQIEAALRTGSSRALRITAGGHSIWIKRPRRGPGYAMYGLQAFAARALGMPVLYPPKVSRGAAGLAGEARRLRRLAARGWPVPHVIEVTERWLALSDQGTALSKALGQMPQHTRYGMLRETLELLQRLHADNGWHGSAKLGNFTVSDRGYGMIDFEDDLEGTMPLAFLQTRDIMVFLMGAARYATAEPDMITRLLQCAHRAASPEVAADLKLVGHKLALARAALGPVAQHLGREGLALARIADAYRQI